MWIYVHSKYQFCYTYINVLVVCYYGFNIFQLNFYKVSKTQGYYGSGPHPHPQSPPPPENMVKKERDDFTFLVYETAQSILISYYFF